MAIKKKPAKPPRARKGTAETSKLFARRWLELTGEKFGPKFRVPTALVLALETAVPAPAGGGAAAATFVFARKKQGTGCDQKAEIAGWYSAPVGPGGCIGQAAVLAALNAAAAQECCKVLKCPEICPCQYIPQAALAAYTCTATLEEGYLLQGKEVWNCLCVLKVQS